jgi:hypothetical protein
MQLWCKNCEHLLPLRNNKRTINWRQWWAKNRKQLKLMHMNGECNTNDHQIIKIEK